MIKESIRIVCDTAEMSSLVEKSLVEYGLKRLNDGLLIKNPIYFIISKDSKAYLISDSSEVFSYYHNFKQVSLSEFQKIFNTTSGQFLVGIGGLSYQRRLSLVNSLVSNGFTGNKIHDTHSQLVLDFLTGTWTSGGTPECRITGLPKYDIEKIWSNEVGLELNTRRIKPIVEAPVVKDVQSLDEKMNIIKLYLTGEHCQFIHSGEQWHNITEKFSIGQLTSKGIRLRVAPTKVKIDGHSLTKQQAIDYIEKHYK